MWRGWGGGSGVWTAGQGSTLVTWQQRTSDATHQHRPVRGDEAALLRTSHHLGCDAVLHAAQGSQGVGVDGPRPSFPAESTRMHTARHAWGRRRAREWRPGTAAAGACPLTDLLQGCRYSSLHTISAKHGTGSFCRRTCVRWQAWRGRLPTVPDTRRGQGTATGMPDAESHQWGAADDRRGVWVDGALLAGRGEWRSHLVACTCPGSPPPTSCTSIAAGGRRRGPRGGPEVPRATGQG